MKLSKPHLYLTKSPIYVVSKVSSISLVHRQWTVTNFGGAVVVVIALWFMY